jgi:hypothetical protein
MSKWCKLSYNPHYSAKKEHKLTVVHCISYSDHILHIGKVTLHAKTCCAANPRHGIEQRLPASNDTHFRVYYPLCWVLSARYLPVAVLRAVISVLNLLFLGSIFIVKYYKIFGIFCRHPNIYSAF